MTNSPETGNFDSVSDNVRLQELGGADASDYSTVFLPWGPKWNAEKGTLKVMT